MSMNLKITPFDSPTAAVFEKLEIYRSNERELSPNNLQLFKRLLEMSKTGLHYHPYTMKKRGIFFYRAFFFSMGLILSLLTIYIHTASYNFLAAHFSSVAYFAKIFMTSISSVLAFAGFVIAAKIRPHREIVLEAVKKGKKKGRRLYLKKIFFLQYQKTIEHAEIDDAKTAWRFFYEDFLEYLEAEKERALLLVERIYIAKTLSGLEKEKLFNEAIYELEENLKKALREFRSGKSFI